MKLGRVIPIAIMLVLGVVVLDVVAPAVFGGAVASYVLVMPGVMVTSPIEAVTGWSCSLWLGGHGPGCEAGFGGLLLLLAAVWAIRRLWGSNFVPERHGHVRTKS